MVLGPSRPAVDNALLAPESCVASWTVDEKGGTAVGHGPRCCQRAEPSARQAGEAHGADQDEGAGLGTARRQEDVAHERERKRQGRESNFYTLRVAAKITYIFRQ